MTDPTTIRAEPRAPASRTVPARAGIALIFGLAAILGGLPPASADGERPNDLIEIDAPHPFEISGVAAVPGGFAVVGDETNDHGRLWPSGGRWRIAPPVPGPESVDVGFGPFGEHVWLVLGEDSRTLADLSGGRYVFPERYQEVCGRGLEGLAVRWNDGVWEVAALWEGGFFAPGCAAPAAFAKPKVALLRWQRGQGTHGPSDEFELDLPRPDDKERFRAPDLVWDGDGLLVLLSSQDKTDKSFSYTWLQPFDMVGKPVGEPLKLEQAWGGYRDKKNWEALDWMLDGTGLVMGFDAKKGRRVLVAFPYP